MDSRLKCQSTWIADFQESILLLYSLQFIDTISLLLPPSTSSSNDYHRLKTRCDTPTTAAGISDGSAPEIPPLSLCIGPEVPVLVVHCDLAAAEIRMHGHIGRSSLVFEQQTWLVDAADQY